MWGIGRLVVTAVAAVAAFLIALVSFHQVPISQCEITAPSDATYSINLVEAPTVNSTSYHIRVTHNGLPVIGATVCARADMGGAGGMSGMGTADVAKPVSPGIYGINLMFQMGGTWEGQIVVIPHGGEPVETRFSKMAT